MEEVVVSPSEPYSSLVCLGLCGCVLSCVQLCDPMDCSPPGSSVREILEARILEWVAIFSSRGSFLPRDGTCVSCISCLHRQILYHRATWEAHVWVCENAEMDSGHGSSFFPTTWANSTPNPTSYPSGIPLLTSL